MINTIKTLTLILCLIVSTSVYSAGLASWYGPGFHGKRTASGAIYNMYAMTAAHKTLPFGSEVEVTNVENKKSVVLKITDRGPFTPGRIIDVSKKANQLLSCDLCKVTVKVLSRGDGKYNRE